MSGAAAPAVNVVHPMATLKCKPACNGTLWRCCLFAQWEDRMEGEFNGQNAT